MPSTQLPGTGLMTALFCPSSLTSPSHSPRPTQVCVDSLLRVRALLAADPLTVMKGGASSSSSSSSKVKVTALPLIIKVGSVEEGRNGAQWIPVLSWALFQVTLLPHLDLAPCRVCTHLSHRG